MPANTTRQPKYRYHKARDCAAVTINGKDYYLGEYGSEESWAKYHRLIAEWAANGFRTPDARNREEGNSGPTVNEVILPFWRHAEQYYRRPDRTQTSEVAEYKRALSVLRRLYGSEPAADFGPLKLEACQQHMVGQGLSRGVINQRIGRIKRFIKWAVSKELVPPSVYHGLQAVAGLKRGRCEARETEPVSPVSPAVVEATSPFLSRQVRAMVQVQLLSGARPGEVCVMRACDIDMTGTVWLYRPQLHKTAHHGHQRCIAIGPQAQQVVRPFLKLNTQSYLFSPAEATAERRADQRRNRKSKVQPSQVSRHKPNPKKVPGERYSVSSYGHAIRRGVDAANNANSCEPCQKLKPEERCEACRAAAIPYWHPHQLRHQRATEIRRRYGLEEAQVILGHARADVTQVYAERDLGLAVRVAAEIG